MDILTNVTEWHDELVTSYGAWQLDEATGIYVWDASLEVTYMQHVLKKKILMNLNLYIFQMIHP